MKVLEMTQHLNIAWHPGTKEWFCTTCGRTSDHASAKEAQVELDEHECRIPSVEVSPTAPGTKTMRLIRSLTKWHPNRQVIGSNWWIANSMIYLLWNLFVVTFRRAESAV